MPSLYEALSDDELVRLFAAGNPEAVVALWDRHRTGCKRAIRRFISDPTDVEDALAETRLRLLERSSGYTIGTSFRAWLATVARNIARDMARSSRRMRMLEQSADHWEWLIDDHVELPECIRSEMHRRGSRLRSEIKRLLPDLAAVTWMRAVGASHGAIADVLGEPLGVIKRRVYNARDALAEMERERGSAGEV